MLCSVAVYEKETRPAASSKEAPESCSCVPGFQASQDPLFAGAGTASMASPVEGMQGGCAHYWKQCVPLGAG